MRSMIKACLQYKIVFNKIECSVNKKVIKVNYTCIDLQYY